MYRKFKASKEQKKKRFRNRYYYNAKKGELVDCAIRRCLYYQKRYDLKIPPTEKQLELLEKLQLKCMLYGIPCKLEFQAARKSRDAASSTIYRIRKRLWEETHGNI